MLLVHVETMGNLSHALAYSNTISLEHHKNIERDSPEILVRSEKKDDINPVKQEKWHKREND